VIGDLPPRFGSPAAHGDFAVVDIDQTHLDQTQPGRIRGLVIPLPDLSVKHFPDSPYGAVDALEYNDLRRVQSLLTTLHATWVADVIRRYDAGEAAGHFALAPAILGYYVPPRGRHSTVQRRVLLSPGLTYGSALWEPLVPTLLAALRAATMTRPFYDRGLSSEVSVIEAQTGAAAEIAMLRQSLLHAR